MDANNWGVVVGYDGSAGAQLALDWAAEVARREGMPLTILHALVLAAIPGYRAVDPLLGSTSTSYAEMGTGVLEQGVAVGQGISIAATAQDSYRSIAPRPRARHANWRVAATSR